MKNKIVYLFTLLILLGCAKEEFGGITKTSSNAVQNRETFGSDYCSDFTLIKPPVDFLLLFDNSTSTNFNNQVQEALRGTVSYISDNFDYHIMVAPLLRGSSVNEGAALAVAQNVGLGSSAQSIIVANDSNALLDRAAAVAPAQGNNNEYGFERVYEVINNNRSNGIFRSNAYTIVVVISNEDATPRLPDGTPDNYPAYLERDDFNLNKNNLINLSNNVLSAEQFRLVTLVPGSDNCQPYYNNGRRYREMSSEIYQHNLSKQGFSGSASTPYDNYDICSGNYSAIFNEINNSIRQIVVGHRYNYWLVTENTNASIDPSEIRVFKRDGPGSSGEYELAESTSNGFQYVGVRSNQNTRVDPTPGEPRTGHMIRLFGNAQVNYPQCLRVTTLAASDYFGYIVAAEEPNVSTIRFLKNGSEFSQSTSNGWEYIGFRSNFNIRTNGPGSHTPASPAVNRTGYIIKLNGTATYTNGDSVELLYFAAPK